MMPCAETVPPTTSSNRMPPIARFAWLTLACNIAVILWGAYVRATGSGAGCGNKWPLCNGDVLPNTAHAHTAIEFAHRISSALVVVLVSSLVVWTWRRTSKGAWTRYSATLATILLLNEALLGALLVVFDRVAQDQSSGHALLLGLHFGNTLLLIASLSLTAYWLSNGECRFTVSRKPGKTDAIGIGLAAVMIIGITGSLAGLVDTTFPATSLRASLMQDFSASSYHLLRLRLLHPIAAMIGGIYVVWIISKGSTRHVRFSPRPSVLIMVFILQIALGAMNVVMLAPVWLQIVHLFIADVFWILLVLASANLCLGSEAVKTKRHARDVTQRVASTFGIATYGSKLAIVDDESRYPERQDAQGKSSCLGAR